MFASFARPIFGTRRWSVRNLFSLVLTIFGSDLTPHSSLLLFHPLF